MGRSWKHTPTKKHSTNGVQDGMHLGIDLLTILLDVWCRVGKQSQPRIDFGTKIQHNTSKNRLQEASRNDRVWDRFFRLTLFPNSFVLFPNSFGRGTIQVEEFGNKAKRVRVQE